MSVKYFNYFKNYSDVFNQFSSQEDIKEEIEFLRSEITDKPHIVGFSVRYLIERIVKHLVVKNSLASENSLFELIQLLMKNKLITSDLNHLFHELRVKSNKIVHGEDISPKSVENTLILLDKLFRVYLHDYYDRNVNKEPNIKDTIPIVTYMPFERKLIYIQSAENNEGMLSKYKGLNKIGDASIPNEIEVDLSPNSDYLRKYARRRINQYMMTAGLNYKLHWAQLAVDKENKIFRDYKVHKVLKRSGYEPEKMGFNSEGHPNEWYKVKVETAKDAIMAVKEGREALDVYKAVSDEPQIILRPEQLEAIRQTKRIFKQKDKMLWNAKMRFGKTLTALELIKEESFNKVLILTHRPVVKDGWFTDFNKIFYDGSYLYGSKNLGVNIENLIENVTPFIYFASIQDLRGSEWAGGTQGNKNLEFKEIDWDLIIIDEAHEGSDTELANKVKDTLKKEQTKLLELSGTPFNLLDKYDEDNIFTWDYTMEQEAKEEWRIKNPNLPNPYYELPKVSMFTYNIPKSFKFYDETKSFNFKEFFKVDFDKPEKLVYEKDVKKFLDYITTFKENTNFPFSTKEFRESLRHTLWLMPGVKEANAFERVLTSHPIFGEYNIVNVVKEGDSEFETLNDLEIVRNAIGEDPSISKTITLTVRKLTTGVNVPEWTGVIFLSNTESPTSYLQAAFRAQTPFNHSSLGVKKNAYIFDFAPDRALKIVSESVGLTSKKGKINSTEQEEKVERLLNFLPILGEANNGMKSYSVDNMLTELKKAFAEKAVRSGFEDSSLYNDRLLDLDEEALAKFDNLRGIVGSTKSNRKREVPVNKSGFDKEKYDKARKAERKKKNERTPEEMELLLELRERRKQRNAMISILRGISIRIPLMIYGMDVDIKEDISVDKFVKLVDEESWKEFMPAGLTKKDFIEFTTYYDHQVFLEAGRIIRDRAKSYDSLDVLERTEKIGELFGTFKNPDKETILTPWRVVNMGMVQTIGGLSYYNKDFSSTYIDGSPAIHWETTNITNEVFSNQNKLIDINSKTGLYPLFAATSMYYKKLMEVNEREAGKFVPNKIWKEVLQNNIYAIANTPMAKTITKRTLCGFKEYKTNVVYIDKLVEKMENPKIECYKIIEEALGGMKFNVVIGNPPYQEVTAKKETENGQKSVRNIFQYFQLEALNLAKDYSVLIYPGGRWMHYSGRGLKNFGMDLINNPRLSKIIFYPNANEVFPKVGIDDGISIVLIDQKKNSNQFEYEYVNGNKRQVIKLNSPGKDLIPLNPMDKSIVDKIDEFVNKYQLNYLSESIHSRSLFGIESDFVEKNPEKVNEYMDENYNKDKYVKLLANNISGSAGRAMWFLINKNMVKSNINLIKKWQVVVSSAHPGGQNNRDNKIEVVDNNSIFARSRLALKSFDTEIEANNFESYAKSKAIKYAFLMTKESLSSLAKRVPDLIDYSSENLVDFSSDINTQLYNLWGLTEEERKYIEEIVDGE